MKIVWSSLKLDIYHVFHVEIKDVCLQADNSDYLLGGIYLSFLISACDLMTSCSESIERKKKLTLEEVEMLFYPLFEGILTVHVLLHDSKGDMHGFFPLDENIWLISF